MSIYASIREKWCFLEGLMEGHLREYTLQSELHRENPGYASIP